MTVAELIEDLKKFPPEYPVYIFEALLEDPIDPQPGVEDVYLSDAPNKVIKAVTLN